MDRAVKISVDLKKKYPKLKEFREAMTKEVGGEAGCIAGRGALQVTAPKPPQQRRLHAHHAARAY